MLVPLLPPLELGKIEISILEFLTIPAVIYLLFSRNFSIFKGTIPNLFLFYFIFSFLSFLSFAFYTQSFSIEIFFRLIRLIEIILPIIIIYQIRGSLSFQNIVFLFLLGCSATGLTSIFLFLSNKSLCDSQTFAGGSIFRAAGTHCDTSSFGNLMGIAVIVSSWVLLNWRKINFLGFKRGTKVIAYLTTLITFLALILSSSRGGWVLVAVGFLFLLLPYLNLRNLNYTFVKKMFVAVFFMSAILVTLFVWQKDNELIEIAFNAFQERLFGLSEIGSSFEDVSSGRLTNWLTGWSIFVDTPSAWLFGLGYKSLILEYNIPPDNNFLQAFLEMGFFGFLSLILFVFAIFQYGYRVYLKNKTLGSLVLGIWAGMIANMLVVDAITFWHNIPPILILILCTPSITSLPSKEFKEFNFWKRPFCS